MLKASRQTLLPLGGFLPLFSCRVFYFHVYLCCWYPKTNCGRTLILLRLELVFFCVSITCTWNDLQYNKKPISYSEVKEGFLDCKCHSWGTFVWLLLGIPYWSSHQQWLPGLWYIPRHFCLAQLQSKCVHVACALRLKNVMYSLQLPTKEDV